MSNDLLQDKPPSKYPVTILRQLSYSSCLALHGCPRKYLLNKSLPKGYAAEAGSSIDMSDLDELLDPLGIGTAQPQPRERSEAQIKQSVTFAYGKAVGLGVQSFLEGKEPDTVMLDMFREWDTYLLDVDTKSNKSFFEAQLAVEAFMYLNTLDFDIADYELVYLPNGKPAVELSFVIQLPGGARYRGFIDAVLRNKYNGEIIVLECKTTGSKYLNAARYKNSEQALGYAIVLDRIFGKLSSYSVVYTTFLSATGKWEVFKFPKTPVQRMEWFRNTLSDLEHLEGYIEQEYFPTRGENCEAWMRPCDYIDVCHTDLSEFFVADIATDNDADFDYVITLDELMDSQFNAISLVEYNEEPVS